MKRTIAIATLAVAAAACWYLRHPAGAARASDAGGRASDLGRRASDLGPRTSDLGPLDQVKRLANAQERQLVADRIAAAQATRLRARELPHLPAPLPALHSWNEDPQTTKSTIRDAMHDVVPMLAACYEAALPTLPSPDLDIVAQLTLTGDPDVGTLIDAPLLHDKAGQPLAPELDDCLRTNLQLIELPPLAEGDTLEVHYPFVFRRR